MSKTIFALLATIFLLFLSGNVYLNYKVRFFSSEVRAPIKSLLFSIEKSKFTGSYWENEMTSIYSEAVSELNRENRYQYFLAIVIFANLDTSSSTLFLDMLKKDDSNFHEYLEGLSNKPLYEALHKDDIDSAMAWKETAKINMSHKKFYQE